ncbi:unnamed protein product [Litomosoides sigmodontis]|uniref:Domain of unknown function DB domain-containing protein n=1 Tax=Litomosoides sigmodontis TaxID=42156 RepID=A0A3P6TJB7_LITSI|nr:unnamed protein product [Litomosoides sigmodontis]
MLFSVTGKMRMLLAGFLLANLLALGEGFTMKHTYTYQHYYLGDAKLRQPSAADDKFKQCCAHQIQSDSCTDEMCTFSGISKMTPSQFLTSSWKCKTDLPKMWKCASQMTDLSPCCIGSGVPGKCLNYCNGTARLRMDFSGALACLPYSSPIIRCFKKNFLTL